MKNLKYLVLFSFVVLVFFACKPKEKKMVCAKWNDSWYEAEVVSEADGKVHVIYSDKTEGDVASADIKQPLEKDKIKVDDRVLAVWTSGLFYEGSIVELKEDGAIVKWDDGSSPSLVAYGKIVAGFPKVEKLSYATCTGKSVCAKWASTWYEAKIVSQTADKVHVIYYDSVEGDVTMADIKELIMDKSKLAVNDKVFAVWTSGIFYPGTITKIEDAGVTVKWDDGSTPSIVPFGKIVK